MGSNTEVYQGALEENILLAQSLVRNLDEQGQAEKQAYERGWRDCGAALAYFGQEMWENGYEACERDVDASWAEVAKRSRYLGSPESKTNDQLQAVRAGIPWKLVKDWPVTGGYTITEADWLEFREFMATRTKKVSA